MRHFQMKFNHGVEIGAQLAYLGHYRRTKNLIVLGIAQDEADHLRILEEMLEFMGHKPSFLIDLPFRIVGTIIYNLCAISPIFALNFVARTMEKFAIFNYRKLAIKYPQFSGHFAEMAAKELEHEKYFSH